MAKSGRNNEQQTEWTRYGIITLVVGIIGVILAALALPQFNAALFPTVVPIPSATPTEGIPFTEDEIGVVVATFGGDYTNPQISMLEVLNAAADSVDNVRVISIAHEITSREQALTIGELYNATVVVYGRVEAGGVTVNYEILAEIDTKLEDELRISAANVENLDIFLYEGMDINYILFFTMGQLLYSDEQYEAALPFFEEAITYLPSGRENEVKAEWLYFYLGRILDDPEQKLTAFSQAIELNPNDTTFYYNRSSVYFELKQYEPIIFDYTSILEINENDATAYYNRGLAYLHLEQYEQAIADFDLSIPICEVDCAADYYNRALAYYYLEQYDKAIADNTRAIELKENYVIAYINRGIAYRNLERYEEAIADYTRAIELDENFANAYSELGNTYYEMGIDSYELAIENYERYAELTGSLEPFMETSITEMQEALDSR